MKFLIAALALTITSTAQAQIIRVHGIEVDAQNIDYFTGSDKIHRFDLAAPVTFPFARGNSFVASETVYLHEDGTIAIITSQASEKTAWKLPGGQVLLLDCEAKRNNWGEKVSRIVSFHQNGEYKSGCAAAQPFVFPAKFGGSIEAAGDIDLNSDLSLSYSSKIASGKLTMKGGTINLWPGTEIDFHSGGQPHFFTLAQGESFRVQQGEYGELLLTQSSGRHISTSFFEDGSVERGILGQDLNFRELGASIPAGSGLAFSQDAGKLRISLAILSAKTRINALNNPFFADRLSFNQQEGKYEAMVAETFTFKSPDDRLMDIPPGSVVMLSENLEIFSVRTPVKEVPFQRKQINL